MNSKILIAGIIAVMMCATFAVAPTDADDTGFDIVDETGTSYHFDGAAEHIVSVGYATTLTIVEAGGADKLVAVDKYSTYEQSGNELLKAVDAIDLGSFYGTSNHQNVIVTIVNLVETGEMSLDDPIILTSYPDNEALAAELREAGFEKVLMWTTIDDYSQLIDMVESVSIIAAGEIPESVTVMKDTYNRVVSETADIPEESRTKALYVWYYGGEFTVGNTGIMGSMLQAANANNIGAHTMTNRIRPIFRIQPTTVTSASPIRCKSVRGLSERMKLLTPSVTFSKPPVTVLPIFSTVTASPYILSFSAAVRASGTISQQII